jgi:hypothetical protein
VELTSIRILLSCPNSNGRIVPRASYQQHGKKGTGQNVKREAESGPIHRDAGILNEQMMEKVEHTMSGEASYDQPHTLLEAYDGYRDKNCSY